MNTNSVPVQTLPLLPCPTIAIWDKTIAAAKIEIPIAL